MALTQEGTILVLSSLGVPFYSARGLSQTLEPISQAFDLKRDINGNLVDISLQKFRKYRSTITCSDQSAPALDGIQIGLIITVDCVNELSYKTGSGTAQHSIVTGSARSENGFTFYRPRLNMMVMSFNNQIDEWAADYSWQLELEEV